MEQNRIRVGLIGAGFAGRAHSLAYSSVPMMYPGAPLVERVRLFDVTSQLAEESASQLGWQHATDNWRDITQSDDIDLVDIVTPNDAHAEIAIDAARHGKHVYCEKPLAHDVVSAQQMVEAVQSAGCVHATSFVYRLWPAVAFAKQLIVEGRIGKVLQFQGRFLHEFALDPRTPLTWRLDVERAGSGSLGDIGSHVIDIARHLMGEIVRVSARLKTFVDERPVPSDLGAGFATETSEQTADYRPVRVDDACLLTVEFENGTLGTIETNWMAAGHNNGLSFEVYGECGAIRFSWDHRTDLLVCLADDPPELAGFRTIPIGPKHPEAAPYGPIPGFGMSQRDAFCITVHEVLDAIVSHRGARLDFYDGLRACEVIDAAKRSSESGSWQSC